MGCRFGAFSGAGFERDGVPVCSVLYNAKSKRRLITIEDETGFANLIVWPAVFEQQRRLILNASMLACHGRVQREGEVIHVITDRIEDLSGLLRSVGEREETLAVRPGRGDEARHGVGSDPRVGRGVGDRGPRDISDIRSGSGIKVPTRDFR